MVLIHSANAKIQSSQLKLCGGKGRGLLQLQSHGFNVPEFLILPWSDVEKIIAPIQSAINERLIALINDTENIFQVSRIISSLFEKLVIDDAQVQEIVDCCGRIFGTEYLVSVRSSALAEDGDQHSFAGQLDTYLYVKPIDLINKVKSCIASLYSARVIKYRLSHGLAVNDGMAVIVQRMVIAEKSGVFFTMNTMGNMNESILVAAYGVGEGVVNDQSDSDMYYVERGSNHIRSVIKNKKVKLDINNLDGGVIEQAVPEALKLISVLNDTQILELTSIGLMLENFYKKAQDVEFALTESGRIYLLQTRPITAIPIGEVKVLDNSNIIESYPGVTLPLSFDFAQQAYCGVFSQAARSFDLSDNFIHSHSDVFRNLLIRVNGRIYYQLHNARRILEKVLVTKSSQKAWREFIGLSGLDWPIVAPKLTNQIKALWVFIKLFLTHERTMSHLFITVDKHYDEMREFVKGMKSESAKNIFQNFELALNKITKDWAPTIINDYFAMKIHNIYHGRISAMGLNQYENLANDLLCGIEGMESEQPLIEILEMKHIINSSVELGAIFKKNPITIWNELRQQKSYTEIQNIQAMQELILRIDCYLDRFGDRTLEELKLETPTLKMKPWLLIKMLQNQLSNNASVEVFKQRQNSIRNRAERIVKQHLQGSPFRRKIFFLLLNKARKAVKERENMRLNRARVYGMVKEMFLEVGRRMHSDDLLQKPEDIFYLNLHDLKEYAMLGKRVTMQEIVVAEKENVERFNTMRLPDRLIYSGDIPVVDSYNITSVLSNDKLFGIGVSKGTTQGIARVLDQATMDLKINGEILFTRMTDPGWVFLIAQSAGLVSEKGSLLSHTAIIGREFGIPTIVGVDDVTRLVKSGDLVHINGDLGEVDILERVKLKHGSSPSDSINGVRDTP